MSFSLDEQIKHCIDAVARMHLVISKGQWVKLEHQRRAIDAEMGKLKSLLDGGADVDDQQLDRLIFLDVQIRRTQRLLSRHAATAKADIATLDGGIRKVQNTLALLKE